MSRLTQLFYDPYMNLQFSASVQENWPQLSFMDPIVALINGTPQEECLSLIMNNLSAVNEFISHYTFTMSRN